MSGHSKWATTKHQKAITDAKRAKNFTKLLKEITVAAKLGDPNPDFNPRLRSAVIAAKAASMPKVNIENAIKKASSSGTGENWSEMRYEGYGPNGIAIIAEALTDNKNRTAGDVRHAFDKFGGSLGATGCVSYLFNRKGIVEVSLEGKDVDALMMDALESGAVDVVDYEDVCEVVTEQNDHNNVADAMKAKGYEIINAETRLVPDSYVDLDQDKLTKFNRMIEMLEDLDDVQEVYHNVNMPDEEE